MEPRWPLTSLVTRPATNGERLKQGADDAATFQLCDATRNLVIYEQVSLKGPYAAEIPSAAGVVFCAFQTSSYPHYPSSIPARWPSLIYVDSLYTGSARRSNAAAIEGGDFAMALIGHSLATGDGLLLAVDPHVCEIMHREERELIGVTFQSLTHPDDLDKNVAAVMALRIQDGPLSVRKRYVRIDGSAVWSSITVSRLRADDGSRLVGTIELIDAPALIAAPESLWQSAKRVSALIERRRAELSDDLFNDYAWLILLQIYLAEAEGRKADLVYITKAVRIRYALAERWVSVLESRGLIDRTPWTELVPQLTTSGMSKLERLLNSNIDY